MPLSCVALRDNVRVGLYDDVPDEQITSSQLDVLAASGDPADRIRAERLRAELGATLKTISFRLPMLEWQKQFTASMREGEEERSRALAELAKIQGERAARRSAAEAATIDTPLLLDALVSLSEAQQAQLGRLQTLLHAMVEQTAALTQLTSSGAIEDDRRWRKAWPAQKAEVTLAALAAVAAMIAIWAAFAAAKPPVVHLPPPVVNVETPAPVQGNTEPGDRAPSEAPSTTVAPGG